MGRAKRMIIACVPPRWIWHRCQMSCRESHRSCLLQPSTRQPLSVCTTQVISCKCTPNKHSIHDVKVDVKMTLKSNYCTGKNLHLIMSNIVTMIGPLLSMPWINIHSQKSLSETKVRCAPPCSATLMVK